METAIIAVILVAQIALAVWMWNLYQNARRDLNARVAEAPMLTEVHALQRTVKELLGAIEDASQDTTARLEVRCAEARFLLGALEERLSEVEVHEALPTPEPRGRDAIASNTAEQLLYEAKGLETRPTVQSDTSPFVTIVEEEFEPAQEDREMLYQRAYALAEIGEPLENIARETGISEGELELMLRLRGHTS